MYMKATLHIGVFSFGILACSALTQVQHHCFFEPWVCDRDWKMKELAELTIPRRKSTRGPVALITRTSACSNNPCQHGGSCFGRPRDYLCLCSKCYTGNYCEKVISEPRRDDLGNLPSYWCDGTIDCFNGVDEANCSLPLESEVTEGALRSSSTPFATDVDKASSYKQTDGRRPTTSRTLQRTSTSEAADKRMTSLLRAARRKRSPLTGKAASREYPAFRMHVTCALLAVPSLYM